MTVRHLVIFACIVSVMVGAVIWFLRGEHAAYDPAIAKPEAAATPSPVAPSPEHHTEPVPREPARPGTAVAETPKLDPILAEDFLSIDRTLKHYPGASEQNHTTAAQALIVLLPKLRTEAQVQCLRHISNLLPDGEFERVMPIWKNPDTSPDVIEALSAELMKRDRNVMLPAMVEAVRLSHHPYCEEAKKNLRLVLDADYGDDPIQWDSAVRNILRKEADASK